MLPSIVHPVRAPILSCYLFRSASTSSADDRAAIVAGSSARYCGVSVKVRKRFSAVTLLVGIRCLNFADARFPADAFNCRL